jgi:NADPH-ferrihemoprotein reductase
MQDYIIAAGLILVGIYFVFIRKTEDIPNDDDFIVDPNSLKDKEVEELDPTVTKKYNVPKSDVSNLKIPDNFPQEVEIYFGSQTGTSEKFARIVEEEAHDLGIIAKVVDMEDFDKDEFKNTELAILLAATHGEGDPTDNALRFHTWLKKSAKAKETEMLKGVNFTVFALGDTEYEKYCGAGKFFDTKLGECGANRVFDLGMGDSSNDLEGDFAKWKTELWPALIAHWQKLAPNGNGNKPRPPPTLVKVKYPLVMGEPGEVNEEHQIQPLCIRQYVAGTDVKVDSIRELNQSDKYGSCLEIIYDLEGSGLRYNTAANLAVFAENSQQDVDRVVSRFGLEKDYRFVFKNAEGDSDKLKHPFPTPCTVGEALTKFCELKGPIDRKIFKDLSQYAKEDSDKNELERLSKNDSTEDIEVMKEEYVNIIDIMEEFKSIELSCEVLLQLLPKMMPRYYTIASSSKLSPTKVRIAISLSEYTSKKGKKFIGLTSDYLQRLKNEGVEGVTSRIFIKESLFQYPEDLKAPIIMVGPGTGVAPFIAFSEEREKLKQENPDIELGCAIMYFGCKESQHDYIYKDELMKWVDSKMITIIMEAFSREQDEKIYVQDRLKINADLIKDMMINQNAHFFM